MIIIKVRVVVTFEGRQGSGAAKRASGLSVMCSFSDGQGYWFWVNHQAVCFCLPPLPLFCICAVFHNQRLAKRMGGVALGQRAEGRDCSPGARGREGADGGGRAERTEIYCFLR